MSAPSTVPWLAKAVKAPSGRPFAASSRTMVMVRFTAVSAGCVGSRSGLSWCASKARLRVAATMVVCPTAMVAGAGDAAARSTARTTPSRTMPSVRGSYMSPKPTK